MLLRYIALAVTSLVVGVFLGTILSRVVIGREVRSGGWIREKAQYERRLQDYAATLVVSGIHPEQAMALAEKNFQVESDALAKFHDWAPTQSQDFSWHEP